MASTPIVSPPLEHLPSLLCILGKDVGRADSFPLVAQSLFDYVPIEAVLCEQCCARSPQIVKVRGSISNVSPSRALVGAACLHL
jgi:hypothetical protein